jgi:hypothetical protein
MGNVCASEVEALETVITDLKPWLSAKRKEDFNCFDDIESLALAKRLRQSCEAHSEAITLNKTLFTALNEGDANETRNALDMLSLLTNHDASDTGRAGTTLRHIYFSSSGSGQMFRWMNRWAEKNDSHGKSVVRRVIKVTQLWIKQFPPARDPRTNNLMKIVHIGPSLL